MTKWYQTEGTENGIVLSSRIRLARNVVDFPFRSKMTPEQSEKLNLLVKEALEKMNLGGNQLHFCPMKELSQLKRYAMVEQHIISREFADAAPAGMLALSEDESISIMVNEEDHIRIQIMANGLNLTESYQLCNQIDDVLDESLHYAFDEKLGYLTSCPTNLGTGLRASVMMHLPALEKSGLISRLTSTINKLGLTIRGTYGEGSRVLGSIYQISNQITLGITEQDAIQNLESVVRQIIESEKKARENLLQNRYQLEDVVYRSLGTLRYARLISGNDVFEALSNVRLGVAMGIIQEVSLTTLNELMNLTGAATVSAQAEKEISVTERDYRRGAIIREKLGESFS